MPINLTVRRPTFTRAPSDTGSEAGLIMNEYNRSPSPAPSFVIDDSFTPHAETERRPSVTVLDRPRTVLADHWRELTVGAALISLTSWMIALQVQFNAFLPWCDDVADR